MANRDSDVAFVLRAVAFAADKHRRHLRRDGETPYINHPVTVARILAEHGNVKDGEILAAAALHDTIEDTDTTEDELRTEFGERVSSLVMECTDDKSLPKQERKRLQIVNAPHKTDGAKQIKIADKISNMLDIVEYPPPDWALQRKQEYIEWADSVYAGCKGVNAGLDRLFEKTRDECRKALG